MENQIVGPSLEESIAALWTKIDTMAPEAFLAAMENLLSALPANHPRAAFERASAHDSLGREAEAAPLYQAALDAGLDDEHRRQASIQYASTLRNLGRAAEGLAILTAEGDRCSDALDDAIVIFRALLLSDLGRNDEALADTIAALGRHLPRYNRSVAAYAAALRSRFDTEDG